MSTFDPFFRNGRTRALVLVVLAVIVLAFGVIDVLPGAEATSPPLHRSAFTVYTEAGAAFFDGRDPYAVTNVRGWYYVYPPLFAIVVSPLHRLDGGAQALVWLLASIVMMFACYFECLRILHAVTPPDGQAKVVDRTVPSWLGVTPSLAVFFPGMECLREGQVGIALLYLSLLGLRLIIAGTSRVEWTFGGIILAAGVVLKLTPAVPAALLIGGSWMSSRLRGDAARSRGRAKAATVGMTTGLLLFVLVVPSAFVGWRANLGHLTTFTKRVILDVGLGGRREQEIDRWWAGNQSVLFSGRRFGNWLMSGGRVTEAEISERRDTPMDSTAGRAALQAVRLALALLLGCAAWQLSRFGRLLDHATTFALGCTAMLLLPPVAWVHHYVLQVPSALLVPLWLAWNGSRSAAVVMAVVPIVASAQQDWYRHSFALIGWLGVTTMMWFVAACFMILATHSLSTATRHERRLAAPV